SQAPRKTSRMAQRSLRQNLASIISDLFPPVPLYRAKMIFTQKLQQAWATSNSMLTVGLDPDPQRFPAELQGRSDAIFEFCRAIIDVTAPYACAIKPQIAYFSAQRAEDQLEALCLHILEHYPDLPIVLDAKRGDIG